MWSIKGHKTLGFGEKLLLFGGALFTICISYTSHVFAADYSISITTSGTVNITFRYVNKDDGSVASEYIYTYIVDDTGNITLQSIQ